MVSINNKSYPFSGGETILGLLRRIGIEVPALCSDERLPPASVCRLCLVKVNGMSRWQPACSTLLSDGMEIETHTPDIESYRKDILQWMARGYPYAEIAKNPQKELHKWFLSYSIQEMKEDRVSPIDTSHAYIQVDMSRCIHCQKCVSICNKLQGQFVWHVAGRGAESTIIPDSSGFFANSSCVSCGACADTCPTGAIEDKQAIQYGNPETTIRSVCAYCGVGCEIETGVKNGLITGIHPAQNAPVNKGHLCVKGRYAWEYNYANDRVIHPMIRKSGKWETVTWEEAIGYSAQKLQATAREYGPDSIGIIGSARATNEDNYLIQKFARVVIGTNNVDNCARVCHQPTAKAMSMALGTGASTNSFDDIELAKTILVAGANATESHPVVGARIKQAALKGANLIVIDPRKTELAKYATCHLSLKPGTNIPLFNAMAQVIIEENLTDLVFIRNRTRGWEAFKEYVSAWTPERAAKICRLHPHLIRYAARLFAKEAPTWCCHGLGLTEHTQGTENVLALINLALITGNIGKAGAGINPLRGQNNVQGSAVMGCDPSVYTGMASVLTQRDRFEGYWKTALPHRKGLNLPEMLDAASAGALKAMWITGYDVFFTMPNAAATKKAFDNLDFVIVQDLFMNETAEQFADVFFPVASSFEKEGTFMNAERRIQKVRRSVLPPGDVMADWEIVCRMAAAFGRKDWFSYADAKAIWNEIRSVWGYIQGITYERLDQRGLQWPCLDTDHPGTRILHTNRFPTEDGKAALTPVEFRPTEEQPTDEFPFILITGRTLYHFNAGTMTYRTPDRDIDTTDEVHMHPDDAHMGELQEGGMARLTSRYGTICCPVKLDTAVKRGELFLSFSDNRTFVNQITNPRRDRYVQTPEYKITAVRIETY